MPGIPVRIIGGSSEVNVSQIGQLITAPFAYDLVVSKTLDTDNVAVNFYKPRVGFQFVVTGLLITADKNVTQDCIVDVYPANSETDTVVPSTTGILHIEMLKNGSRDILGLNIVAGEGVYINSKTDDNNVFVTIMGYYIPALKDTNGVFG